MLEIYNESGQLLAGPDYATLGATEHGTLTPSGGSWQFLNVGSGPRAVVMLRPQSDGQWVSADLNAAVLGGGSDQVVVWAEGNCDYVLLKPASSGGLMKRSGTVGIQLFSQAGDEYFSSQMWLPRIRQTATKGASSSGYGWPVSMSGFGERPWIFAGSLRISGFGVSEGSENMGCIAAKIDGNSVTFNFTTLGDGFSNFPTNIPNWTEYDPTQGYAQSLQIGSITGM